MALFMLQVSYTNEAWAAQVKNPQERRSVFAGLAEKFGRRLRDAYLALGDADVIAIYEAPDTAARDSTRAPDGDAAGGVTTARGPARHGPRRTVAVSRGSPGSPPVM